MARPFQYEEKYHQIGRLIMALTEHELQNDTVILFTSDHGEELCDHHYFRKSMPYEGSTRLPMILSGNPALLGLKQNSVCHDIVELRDVMPTCFFFYFKLNTHKK